MAKKPKIGKNKGDGFLSLFTWLASKPRCFTLIMINRYGQAAIPPTHFQSLPEQMAKLKKLERRDTRLAIMAPEEDGRTATCTAYYLYKTDQWVTAPEVIGTLGDYVFGDWLDAFPDAPMSYPKPSKP